MPSFDQISMHSNDEQEQSAFSRIASEAYQAGSRALTSATQFISDHPWETAGTVALAAGALYLGRGRMTGLLGKYALGAEGVAGSEALLGKGLMQAGTPEATSMLTSSALEINALSRQQIQTRLLAHDMIAGELSRFPVANLGRPAESMSTSIVDNIYQMAAKNPSLAGGLESGANPLAKQLAGNMWPAAEGAATRTFESNTAAIHSYLLQTESIEHSLARLTPHTAPSAFRVLGSDQSRRSVMAYLLSNVRF